MLKNKIIVKKIRNIFILLMAIIIMFGVYTNIRNSRAENVIQIEMEIADKSNVLENQTVTVDATETKDGNYLLDLPTSVNGNIVTKYYTTDGAEVEMGVENTDSKLELTEIEIANKKVQLHTDYDTKEVVIDNETKTFYNKELKKSMNTCYEIGAFKAFQESGWGSRIQFLATLDFESLSKILHVFFVRTIMVEFTAFP